jgi:hypothetical protein
MIGELPGYNGEVWYNPNGIANNLLTSNVKKYNQVTYDSKNEKAFIVHKADGEDHQFKQLAKGFVLSQLVTPSSLCAPLGGMVAVS